MAHDDFARVNLPAGSKTIYSAGKHRFERILCKGASNVATNVSNHCDGVDRRADSMSVDATDVRPGVASFHEGRRVAVVFGGYEGHAILAPQPDRRVQFQQTRSCLAIQNRPVRPTA